MSESSSEKEVVITNEQHQVSQSRSLLGVINFLLVILVIGTLAVAVWFFKPQYEQYQQQRSVLQQQWQTTTHQVQQDTQQIQRLKQQLHTQQQQTQSFLEQLQLLQQQTQTQQSTRWQLAHVHYLAQLAGNKVYLEYDFMTAQWLLTQADEVLAQLADPALLTIRQQISHDLTVLKSIPLVDTTTLYLSLGTLINQITQLPLKNIHLPKQQKNDVIVSENVADWQHNLWINFTHWFKKIFSIQHRYGNVSGFLPPDQQWYIRANIILALQQAQLAILQRDIKTYRHSINQGIQLLNQHFDLSTTLVSTTLATLKTHLQQGIEYNLPSSLQSPQGIYQYLQLTPTSTVDTEDGV